MFFTLHPACEMRSSDWMSEVCSSELLRVDSGTRCIGLADKGLRLSTSKWQLRGGMTTSRQKHAWLIFPCWRPWQGGSRSRRSWRLPNLQIHQSRWARRWSGTAGCDRKSVGKGKSVSVRVDLGGRRFIKKQKTQPEIEIISIKNT